MTKEEVLNPKEQCGVDSCMFNIYFTTSAKDREEFKKWWWKIHSYGYKIDDSDILRYGKEIGLTYAPLKR